MMLMLFGTMSNQYFFTIPFFEHMPCKEKSRPPRYVYIPYFGTTKRYFVRHFGAASVELQRSLGDAAV